MTDTIELSVEFASTNYQYKEFLRSVAQFAFVDAENGTKLSKAESVNGILMCVALYCIRPGRNHAHYQNSVKTATGLKTQMVIGKVATPLFHLSRCCVIYPVITLLYSVISSRTGKLLTPVVEEIIRSKNADESVVRNFFSNSKMFVIFPYPTSI